MKTKEIIAIGLVTLALLAGCNKEKESSTTTTKSVTTPAPSQESTSTTTTTGSPYKSMQVVFYQRVTGIGITNKNLQVNAS
jgi:uncharacterized lipoprotein YajG